MKGNKFERLWVTKELAVTETGTTFTPSPEHLNMINQFTAEPVTADQVLAIPIKAMNDSIDRDYDRFVEAVIDSLVADKSKTSPIGKPFMVSHDRGELAQGRIYHVEKETIAGINHLKAWVYIPNTSQNQDFIENIMFGVYWAVSVGIAVNKAECSVCGCDWPSNFWPECDEGHYKGKVYEGSMCYRDITYCRELYELSSVYLGAQYGAEIAKRMASDKDTRTLELIRKAIAETDIEIPAVEKMPEPIYTWEEVLDQMVKAQYDETIDRSQITEWTTGLGKTTIWDNEKAMTLVGEGATLEPMGDGSLNICKGTKIWTYDGNRVVRSEVKQVQKTIDELKDELAIKVAELEALDIKMKELSDSLDEAKTLNGEITRELEATKDELASKSKVVDSYIEGLKEEALKWYRLSKGSEDTDTAMMVRFLNKCGDEPELIKELISDYEERAKSNMPPEVRRSSFEDDLGAKDAEPQNDDGIANDIHG